MPNVLSSLRAPVPTDFRPDGFPLCPRCEGDELYSDVMMVWDAKTPRPTMEEVSVGSFGCYWCSWKGHVRRREPCPEPPLGAKD